MKILLTTYFALPNLGGLWTYVDQLRRGFERLGHEVDIITHAPQLNKYYLPNKRKVFDKRKVIEVIKEKVYTFFEEKELPMHDEILEIEIERYIMEMAFAYFGIGEYDVIHTQDIISTRAASRIKKQKTPLIATIHGSLTTESVCQGVLREDDTVLYEYLKNHENVGIMSSTETIMPSKWLKNVYVENFQVPEQQMSVVSNGMDIDSFMMRMNEPLKVSRTSGKKIIACNARLDKVKGHEYLFEALAKLKEDRNDWVCWLIGDGEQRDELLQLRHQLGLDDEVIFLGKREDVPALLKACDLCVLPSIQENCPFAVMEAQVAGKIIVASDVGGIPEMIEHEKTGLLTPPAQSDALCCTLQRVLQEDRLRKNLGRDAQKWGRVYWSIAKMRKQTFDIYQRAMRK